MARFRIAAAAVIGMIAGIAVSCARYQHYQPAPVERGREALLYRVRGLAAPRLARFLSDGGAPLGDSGWTSRQLALAALYYRADLAQARDLVSAARAAETTAKARPEPAADATVEKAARADEGKSTPWSFSFTGGLTFELGGKRSARVARARALSLESTLALHATAWRIAQTAREDALALGAADRDLADQEAESAQLGVLAGLLRERYRAGEISLAEVARSDADRQSAAVQRAQIARARSEALAALGRDLAVPVDSLGALRVVPNEPSACTLVDSLPADSLRTLALTTNDNVGVALAEYAVAEADLRIAVSRQYPDLTLGPGIMWDEGIRRWLLSAALPGLPLQTSGPIAEGRARRAAQAAGVQVLEDSVLAAVDSSVSACRVVGVEVAAADSLVAANGRQLDLATAAFQRGEVGQTDVAFARLALVRAQRTRRMALGRGASAGAALERAVGRWLVGPPIRWPDVAVPLDSSRGGR